LTGEGVFVRVRLRRRRMACSVCGQVYSGMHDRDVRRWRHLDLAGHRCFLEYELRRVDCRDCGVRVEAVPWARRGARHTREFEDLVVRHEAPLNRVGCRSPPPDCRSSSVKRGAA
jgi:transposase